MNIELVRDRMQSCNSMLQSLQTQFLTTAVRGKLSPNMALEMIRKLDWLKETISETSRETN